MVLLKIALPGYYNNKGAIDLISIVEIDFNTAINIHEFITDNKPKITIFGFDTHIAISQIMKDDNSISDMKKFFNFDKIYHNSVVNLLK